MTIILREAIKEIKDSLGSWFQSVMEMKEGKEKPPSLWWWEPVAETVHNMGDQEAESKIRRGQE